MYLLSFEVFVYATIVTQFITMSMKFYYMNKILNRYNFKLIDVVREQINFSLMRKLKIFSFIVYNNFDVALRLLSTQFDIVLLGKFYGAEIVGIYKIAKEMSKIVMKITSPVYQSIYPEFAKLLANNKTNEAKNLGLKISMYAGLIGILFYCIFYMFGEILITFVFGIEFIESYFISLVYMIAVIITLISLPLPSLIHSMGLANYAFYNQLASSVIYSGILFVLVMHYSMIGAAIAMVCFHLIWLFIAIIIVQKNLGVKSGKKV
jgi:O-antigen/teichoic acid export membrane protein